MTDDIVAQLLPFIHNEMRMPAGLVKTVIEEIERLTEWQKNALLALDKREAEIERLREQVKDCENDFHTLKQIFDKVRAERDQMKAEHG